MSVIYATLLTLLYSSQAIASDFAGLGVALGSFIIAAIHIGLGFKACSVAKIKGHTKALPLLAVIGFLMFIGVGMVTDEAGHMSEGDTTGMLLMVIIPGVIALLAPFFIRKALPTQPEDKS